jgi:uncharacterized membrane protein
MDLKGIAALIELAGALIIAAYAVRAGYSLLRGASIEYARLVVANGALAGLNFKVAATLLKTLDLQSWQQISMFAAIFALRFILKRAFQADKRMQAAGHMPSPAD